MTCLPAAVSDSVSPILFSLASVWFLRMLSTPLPRGLCTYYGPVPHLLQVSLQMPSLSEAFFNLPCLNSDLFPLSLVPLPQPGALPPSSPSFFSFTHAIYFTCLSSLIRVETPWGQGLLSVFFIPDSLGPWRVPGISMLSKYALNEWMVVIAQSNTLQVFFG